MQIQACPNKAHPKSTKTAFWHKSGPDLRRSYVAEPLWEPLIRLDKIRDVLDSIVAPDTGVARVWRKGATQGYDAKGMTQERDTRV